MRNENANSEEIENKALRPIAEAVLEQLPRTQHVFPFIFPIGQVTLVSMEEAVDGAALAAVCAFKAASGSSLPMFGKGRGMNVDLLMGGIDVDEDADRQAFQRTLLDGENVLCDPSSWPGALRLRQQNRLHALYLNTSSGFAEFHNHIQPDSLVVIYDLKVWLTEKGLTGEAAPNLLENLRNVCSQKAATIVIFERGSFHTLAEEIRSPRDVLKLELDNKGPVLTGLGCLLLRKRKGLYDVAPAACSFWVSLTDAGTLAWGMQPSNGPQLAPQELDAVQRRILTAQWKSGERTPREIAEFLGKNPADYPDQLDQQGIAKLLNVSLLEPIQS